MMVIRGKAAIPIKHFRERNYTPAPTTDGGRWSYFEGPERKARLPLRSA